MTRSNLGRYASAALFLGAGLSPVSAMACAACFGKSDSALAQGMNVGILSLLVVIVLVLASVAGFFVFLARQSAKAAASLNSSGLPETVTRS